MEHLPDSKNCISPLVSIIVITYNNSPYIIETLASIKAQTYQNIELIISDDGSTDNTVEICMRWISESMNRFKNTKLLCSKENTGISANCNRGVNDAQGEWVKLIAGDDIFEIDAVESVIEFVKRNPHIRALDSNVSILNSNFTVKNGFLNENRKLFFDNKTDAVSQLKLLANILNEKRIISTLGVFLKRDLILQAGGFDEEYKLLEDTPMWYRVLKSGEKFYLLDYYTVKYRIHSNSVSYNDKSQSRVILTDFERTLCKFNRDYLFPHLSVLKKVNVLWLSLIYKTTCYLGNKGSVAMAVYQAGLFLQPVRLLWFRRKFSQLMLKR